MPSRCLLAGLALLGWGVLGPHAAAQRAAPAVVVLEDRGAAEAAAGGGQERPTTASRIVTAVLIAGAVTMLGGSDTDTVEDVGDVLQIALPVTALGATYLERDRRGRRDFLKSFGTSTLTVFLLKELLDKSRPNAQGLNSFPSGHTAAAFSGAAFLDLRYGGRYGQPALVLAGYTGASRIVAQKHFLDDVISGMSISLLANRYHVFPVDAGLDLVPVAGEDATGFAVRWKGSALRWRGAADAERRLEPRRGLRYEWEFGGARVVDNDFATAGSPSALSFLFEEVNNPTVTARVELAYLARERHELALQVAPFEVRDFGTLPAATRFAGVVVPGGERLRTQYLLYDYRLRYRYLIESRPWLRLRAGAGLSFQDIVATLTWPAGEADVEEGNFLPFAHVEAELGISDRLRLALEADGGVSGGDRLLDGALTLRYRLHPRWDFGGGVRSIERRVETDLLRNEHRRHQGVISIAYRF